MPFGKVGVWELLVILLIVVAIFGAGKIASLGGALGKGVSDFRKAMGSEEKESDSDSDSETETKKTDEATAKASEAQEKDSGEDA